MHVPVIGAGCQALSAAVGGMAVNDGLVAATALAHAACLVRESHQLDQDGIRVGQFELDSTRTSPETGHGAACRSDRIIPRTGETPVERVGVEAAACSATIAA